MIKMTKIPLEHIFDNHTYCSDSWCHELQAIKNEQRYVSPPNKSFYDKVKDKKMYK